MRGPIQAQPEKGTSLLTAGDFVSPCTARARVDPLFGSGRNCRSCYLLICVAEGAGLHLKTCKRSSRLASAIRRDAFREGSPARLTEEQELGSCFRGP